MTDQIDNSVQESEASPKSLGESIQAIMVREPRNSPDLISAIEPIGKHGVPVDANSIPKAILAAWINIFNGQGRMVEEYVESARVCREELEKAKKDLKKCRDPDERDKHRSDIVYLRRVIFEYDKMRLTAGSKMGESGKDIIHLDGKIRKATEDEGATAISWDPDAAPQRPGASVNVHVHGNAQVELKENHE